MPLKTLRSALRCWREGIRERSGGLILDRRKKMDRYRRGGGKWRVGKEEMTGGGGIDERGVV